MHANQPEQARRCYITGMPGSAEQPTVPAHLRVGLHVGRRRVSSPRRRGAAHAQAAQLGVQVRVRHKVAAAGAGVCCAGARQLAVQAGGHLGLLGGLLLLGLQQNAAVMPHPCTPGVRQQAGHGRTIWCAVVRHNMAVASAQGAKAQGATHRQLLSLHAHACMHGRSPLQSCTPACTKGTSRTGGARASVPHARRPRLPAGSPSRQAPGTGWGRRSGRRASGGQTRSGARAAGACAGQAWRHTWAADLQAEDAVTC